MLMLRMKRTNKQSNNISFIQLIFFTLLSVVGSLYLSTAFIASVQVVAIFFMLSFSFLYYVILKLLPQFKSTSEMLLYVLLSVGVYPLVLGVVLETHFRMFSEKYSPLVIVDKMSASSATVTMRQGFWIMLLYSVFLSAFSLLGSVLLSDILRKVFSKTSKVGLSVMLQNLENKVSNRTMMLSDRLFVLSRYGFVTSVAVVVLHGVLLFAILGLVS